MTELMCLHAAASSPETWDPLVPGLADLGCRVHCPPLLGHRGAERRREYPLTAFRDDVLRELDQRGLERVTLVGHSLGAFVASMVAAARPERVIRLVLEEMPVPPKDSGDGAASRGRAGGLAMRAFALLNRERCDPALFRSVIAELREPQARWWDDLSAVTADTLILAGGEKSHLDQSRYDLLARAVPGSATVTIPAGHRIHRRAPERWLAAVSGFLGSP
ncbi:alpha/beta hydrolase [Amycolatopsis minnesotensis]|uniref:Alpha/beta hydrolase n=1 Tax=Amycolatopsis minnesotensis TaxID=337894 RepID=A0ABP5DF46_9PSEU